MAIHEPGLNSGDVVRASRVGGHRPASPQLVFVDFVAGPPEAKRSVRVRQAFGGRDDEALVGESFLPFSLDRAQGAAIPRSTVTLTPIPSFGDALAARKNRVLDELEQIFDGYNVVFVTDRPTDALFSNDLTYATVLVSASSHDLSDSPSFSLSSYSPWDPGNQLSQEMAFVFDNAAMDDHLLSIGIAHAVAHMLGLDDVQQNNQVMSSAPGFRAGAWAVGSTLFGAAQDDSDLLARAVGRTDVPYPFVSGLIPPSEVAAISTEQPSGLGSTHSSLQSRTSCVVQNIRPRPGGWEVFYLCGPDFIGPWEGHWIEVDGSSERPRGIKEHPPVPSDGGGGGGDPPALPGTVEAVERPMADPRTEELRRGRCRVDKYREIARKRFKGYRSVFKLGTSLGPKETNCVDFTTNYLEAITGKKLDADTKRAMNNVVPRNERDQLVSAGDPKIRGPETALVKAGLGTKVDSLSQALPGDLVQLWWKNDKGGWSGHQMVVSDNIVVDRMDGTTMFHLEFIGAQLGQRVGSTAIMNVDAKVALFPLSAEAAGVKFFIARPGKTPASDLCPD